MRRHNRDFRSYQVATVTIDFASCYQVDGSCPMDGINAEGIGVSFIKYGVNERN